MKATLNEGKRVRAKASLYMYEGGRKGVWERPNADKGEGREREAFLKFQQFNPYEEVINMKNHTLKK